MKKIAALLFFFAMAAAAQSKEEFMSAIAQAKDLGNQEQILRALNDAASLFPDDTDILLERGFFYWEKQLYSEALADYLAAEKLGAANTAYVWKSIADIYGALGLYKDALAYFEKLVNAYPFDHNAQADLLWYYYKTFQLEKGIAAGEAALFNFPDNVQIVSVLAVLYASLYNYERSSQLYDRALYLAQNQGSLDLAAINLYNRYLLEIGFLNYEKAEECLNRALTLEPGSASVQRLFGEFRLQQLDYQGALAAYGRSEEIDGEQSRYGANRTPLSLLGFADFYLTFGDYNRAERYLTGIRQMQDVRWMTAFGINGNMFNAMLFGLYQELWDKRADSEETAISFSWRSGLASRLRWLRAKFYSFYYSQKFKVYALKTGNELHAENNQLDAFSYYQQLAQGYSYAELFFLRKGMLMSQSFIPKAKRIYQAKIAAAKKNKIALYQAFKQLDKQYERRFASEILMDLVALEKNKEQKKRLLETLYGYNKAAVRSFGLPALIRIEASGQEQKRLSGYLRQAAIVHDSEGKYALNVNLEDNSFSFYEGGQLLFSQTVENTNNEKKEKERLYLLAKAIADRIYLIR